MAKRQTALTAQIKPGDTLVFSRKYYKGGYAVVTCTVEKVTEKAVMLKGKKSHYVLTNEYADSIVSIWLPKAALLVSNIGNLTAYYPVDGTPDKVQYDLAHWFEDETGKITNFIDKFGMVALDNLV